VAVNAWDGEGDVAGLDTALDETLDQAVAME